MTWTIKKRWLLPLSSVLLDVLQSSGLCFLTILPRALSAQRSKILISISVRGNNLNNRTKQKHTTKYKFKVMTYLACWRHSRFKIVVNFGENEHQCTRTTSEGVWRGLLRPMCFLCCWGEMLCPATWKKYRMSNTGKILLVRRFQRKIRCAIAG